LWRHGSCCIAEGMCMCGRVCVYVCVCGSYLVSDFLCVWEHKTTCMPPPYIHTTPISNTRQCLQHKGWSHDGMLARHDCMMARHEVAKLLSTHESWPLFSYTFGTLSKLGRLYLTSFLFLLMRFLLQAFYKFPLRCPRGVNSDVTLRASIQ